jgi:hypothetical protein
MMYLHGTAHWLYRYFPTAMLWAKANTWNLQAIFMGLKAAGFVPECRREVFFQSVSLGAAKQITEKSNKFLSLLPKDETKDGLFRLISDIDSYGPQYLLSSECSVIEIWAQKG